MKKLMMILALVVMIGSNFFGHSLMNAMAEEPAGPAMSRCYKSITIQKGDSLWAIAKEYSQDTESVSYTHLFRTKNLDFFQYYS